MTVLSRIVLDHGSPVEVTHGYGSPIVSAHREVTCAHKGDSSLVMICRNASPAGRRFVSPLTWRVLPFVPRCVNHCTLGDRSTVDHEVKYVNAWKASIRKSAAWNSV